MPQCKVANGMGDNRESSRILSKQKEGRPPYWRPPDAEIDGIVLKLLIPPVSPIWGKRLYSVEVYSPFVIKGIIQMDSDKSLTLADNLWTLPGQ